MNRSAAPSQLAAQIKPFPLGAVLMAGICMCCLAIGYRSFWIDEGGVVFKASLPTLRAWWQSMRIDGSANMQLPLHHLFTWFWEKVFGTNEFLFRAPTSHGFWLVLQPLLGDSRLSPYYSEGWFWPL